MAGRLASIAILTLVAAALSGCMTNEEFVRMQGEAEASQSSEGTGTTPTVIAPLPAFNWTVTPQTFSQTTTTSSTRSVTTMPSPSPSPAGATISAEVQVYQPYALAYYNAYLNTATPDISFDVTSGKSGQKSFKIRSQYDGYGSPTVNQSTVTGPFGTTHIEQVLALDLQEIDDIHSATKIPLHYTIEELIGTTWAVVQEETLMVDVLPKDTMVLWFRDDAGIWQSAAQMVAAFVTPTNPAISELIAKASEYHPHSDMDGWQCAGCTEDEWQEAIGAQVGAIYYALQDHYGIEYVNMPGTFNNDRASTQTVNLPADSLRLSSANCIDGVFLFASALERLRIPAGIALRPGHAYLAFQASPAMTTNNEWFGLETTVVGWADAEYAIERGIQKLEEDLPMMNDPDDQRYWLLNVAELHDAGITPLANA